MDFEFKNPKTGEIKTLSLTERQLANLIDDDTLHEEMCKQECQCEPVGETYVVECGCDEYLEDFELQKTQE